jgi:hypothetical protein
VTAKPPTTKKNTAGAQKVRQSHKTQGIRSDAKLTVKDASRPQLGQYDADPPGQHLPRRRYAEQNAGQLAMEAMMCAAIG